MWEVKKSITDLWTYIMLVLQQMYSHLDTWAPIKTYCTQVLSQFMNHRLCVDSYYRTAVAADWY